ncbi:hypothetical protein BGX34_006921, partial [Mortierella sp. NVP85]
MGVGKSYLSYFLVAKAYAEGWLVLYVSDAGLLDRDDQDKAALDLVKRFLGINKSILTGAELQMLVNDYDGSRHISRNALSTIFEPLLRSRERKTLLLVDEHGKLFEGKPPYLPERFPSLNPLSSFNWWDELNKGTRLIFTGVAHAKYTMTILHDSYRWTSVVYVGPLSENVFSRLLDTYHHLASPTIRKEVTAITNRVPRELVNMSTAIKDHSDLAAVDFLQKFTNDRTNDFLQIAVEYYKSRSPLFKEHFYKALLHMFLGSTSTVNFDWDFLDLGLVYRSKSITEIGTQYHILCRPAQRALLELFKTLPLRETTKIRICNGTLDGDAFETALCHQLICTTKPILLNATDLNGRNSTVVTLDFSHCETLQNGKVSLGAGHEKVLTHGYKG